MCCKVDANVCAEFMMIGNVNMQEVDTGLLLLWCIALTILMHTFNTCNVGVLLHRMSTIGFVKRKNKADFR